MYSLQLIGTPHPITFSRNPIVFRFRVSPFSVNELNSRLRVVVAVYVETSSHSNVFQLQWNGAEYPNNKGYASIDIQTIIDANLEFYVPDLSNPFFQKCKHQSKRFYITYQLQDNDGLIGTFDTSINFTGVKGGLSKEENNQPYFFDTIVFLQKKPLHFYVSSQKIRSSEYRFFYFMLNGPNDSLMRLYFSSVYDATLGPAYYLGQQYIVGVRGEIFCVPINLFSLLIGTFTQDVKSFALRVDSATASLTSFVSWDIDYRPFYEETQLLFRNSLGALETQTFVGEKEMSMDIAKTKAELVSRNEMNGLFLLQNEKPTVYSSQRPRYKVNTGWISKEKLDDLRDLMLRKEVFTIYGIRILPVDIMTDSFRMWKTSDKLYALELEYSPAHDDVNYTRELTIPVMGTCPALLFFAASQEKARFVHIVWSLPPGYDTVRVRIYISLVLFTEVFLTGTDGEADIQIQATAVPLNVTNITLEANVQCNPSSFGPTSHAIASIASIMAPVAIDDLADISGRNLGIRTLQLNNSDLKLLANDFAKNGLALSFFGFYNAGGTLVTTSANGANLALVLPDKVSYTPTLTSVAITTEDYFFYKCAENVPGFGWISSNLAKVRVPLTEGRPRIYVKGIVQNLVTNTVSYGILNSQSVFVTTGDFLIQFFLDPACTIPVDVTNFGYTIGYYVKSHWATYNNFGGTTGSGNNPNAYFTQAITGASMLLKINYGFTEWDAGLKKLTINEIWAWPGGSIGDIGYVLW
jgi:hypothetical protein